MQSRHVKKEKAEENPEAQKLKLLHLYIPLKNTLIPIAFVQLSPIPHHDRKHGINESEPFPPFFFFQVRRRRKPTSHSPPSFFLSDGGAHH